MSRVNWFRRRHDNAWTQFDRRERWCTILTVIGALVIVGGIIALLFWSLLRE